MKAIVVGTIVAFSTSPHAVWYTVIATKGDHTLIVREVGKPDTWRPFTTDRDMVQQVK